MDGSHSGHLPTVPVAVTFSVDHALSCPKGSFPTIGHNEIGDVTANLLLIVYQDVSFELTLQPISDETLAGASANTQDDACSDISASRFWGGQFERTFFDVRVFNLHTDISSSQPVTAAMRMPKSEPMDNAFVR